MSQVPRTAVTVLIGVNCAAERTMRLAAVAWGCLAVDRRSHERMTEPDLPGDADQPVCLSRAGILIEADSQGAGSTPENRHVTDGIGCDQQQYLLRRCWKGPRAAQEAFLDPAGQPSRIWETEAAGQLVMAQAVREFEQGQRITVRLGDNPVSHPGVQPAGDDRGQQVAGVGIGEALDKNARNPSEVIQGDAGGEHQGEGIGFGTPRDEGQRLQGFLVDPLRIVDQA